MAQGADFRSRITLDGGDKAAAELQKFGAEGEKAFNAVGRAADQSATSVNAFGRATDAVARQMSSLRSATQTLGAGFSNLHEHATNFGNALGNVANNIIPRFKEIMGLAAVGGVAGFVSLFESTAKWGHELEQNAKMLGITPSQFQEIGKAAKLAGIDVDVLTAAMQRFQVSMEKAREEQLKLFGEVAKGALGATTPVSQGGVQVLRGGRSETPPPVTARVLQLPKLDEFKQQAEEIFAVLQKRGAFAFQPNLTFSRWLAGIQQTLMQGGDAADKLRKELNQLGANLPSRTVGEQIEKAMPGFRDLFAQLNVSLWDKATGSARGFLDVFGDFLDKFKTLPQGEQQKIVFEQFGRGARELIPIMQEGSNSLDKFVKKANELGIDTTPFDKEIDKLSEASRAFRRVDASIMGLRRSAAVPFADVFTPILDNLAGKLKENEGAVKAWATNVATQAEEVARDVIGIFQGAEPKTEFGQLVLLGLNAITIAIGVLRTAFEGLTAVFEPFTNVLNGIFGVNYTAQTYALAAAFLYFSGILPALAAGIRLVWSALMLIYATPFGLALAAIAGAALLIIGNWEKVGPVFWALWDGLKAFGGWLADQWVKFWTDPIQGIKDQWNAVFNWLGAKADQIWQKLKSLNPFAGASMPNIGSPSMSMATGGQVPGTGSGDIVPAMLTPGEFVIRKSVVDSLGAGFFAALNGGMGSFLPRGRYATGGIVAETAGGTPVHLHLGNQSFALSGASNVVSALVLEAHRQHVRSAGVKPSWYGGR